MKKLLAIGALVSALALNLSVDYLEAQTPPPAIVVPVPEITLRVTGAELDIISEGLQTQPFGKVVPLINKLRAQVIEQQQPKPAAPKGDDNAAPKP